MAETIPSTTVAELAQRISNLLDWAEGRDGKWTAWVIGTPTGGPNANGKYPLPYSDTEDVLVECPALLADMVVGPAAAAEAAVVSAEAARDSAIAAEAGAITARDAAQAAQTATVAARDLTLSYRDQAGTHEGNAAAHKDAAAASATAAAGSAAAASTSETNAAASAASAATQATNAAASATTAGTKAAEAATSATNAAGSATGAANSATAASTSETNAAASAATASTKASEAATSATNAAASATGAATEAGNAATSASNAASSASSAATSATNAATSATAAATAQSSAETARDAAQAAQAAAEATAASVDGPTIDARLDTLEASTVRTINGVGPDGVGNVQLDVGGALQSDLVRVFVALAELRGNQFGTPNGVADTFVDVDGVDATASQNEVYEGGAYYAPYEPATGVVYALGPEVPIPSFTSNSPTGGYSLIYNGDISGYNAFEAFDDQTGESYWAVGKTNVPEGGIIGIAMPQAYSVMRYLLRAPTDNASFHYCAPKAWTFEGSNDGTTWTVIETRTNAPAWAPNEERVFDLAEPVSYSRYRLKITATEGGSYYMLAEMKLWQPGEILDPGTPGYQPVMDLWSTGFEALAQPDEGALTVLAKGDSVITPGTHLTGYLSRDGGATWAQASLVAREAVGNFTYYEATDIDLSAQPAGTSMRWRVVTNDQFRVDVTAVVLMWN